MITSHYQSGAIVELLHGSDASQYALSRISQSPTTGHVPISKNIGNICAGVAAAHFDSTANVLHAMGMIATMWVFAYTISLFYLGFGNPKHFLWLPPVYYLPSWIGHFVFQKDIPVVFLHGRTMEGWLNSENCNWQQLFRGETVRNPTEFAYCLAITVAFISLLMYVGVLWPRETVSKRHNKQD